ncbi:PPC domain-containing DNA-binding protein [Paracoccus benzoatiresistens]|uniref:DUF296 domain-containing protein n=1 Tax=Paracoccus benzoatiresistens TaxID=2997341 RepID=A0ABT4J1I8_9RHOB|nr:DUF296 domain-containing protein [Paracoccus sp. EF6]MCZ0960978.1 DUF296 domain-containing protein [Paracoccus sp. EF6]
MHALASSTGTFHAVRLGPGQNLTQGLRRVFADSGTQAMAIVTCVGSLTDVVIRHANQPDGTAYSGHFEITSLTGTLDAKSQHLHLTIADDQGRAFGGHLMPAGSAVFTTTEIVVLALPGLHFDRAPCPLSGYDELVVTGRR